MLIELWERLRGYDKWADTEARVVSFDTYRRLFGAGAKTRPTSRMSSDLLTWKDGKGARRYSGFINFDTSPLYQLLDGNKITIRYDPAKPDRYYNREYFLSWLGFWAKRIAAGVIGGGFIVWRVWMIVKHRGY